MDLEKVAVSVKELNKYVANIIDNDQNLANIVVKGELSNFKKHYTGHIYFTLKDNDSLIKGVCFKTYANEIKEELKDGDSVYVIGSVNVFQRDGIYQIYARQITKSGVGDLYKKYIELKEKLAKEGLFDEKHKVKIPSFPNKIAVLTSSTGSVIRDIINVSTRRNPNVNIRLIPVPVQGKNAHKDIIESIKFVNDNNLADVIILARGGGSLEDLWPFNEEELAYAIYDSKIPIVSSIGHETDFTIADFVSDMRAPTPSAAAELVVPNILDYEQRLIKLQNQLKSNLQNKLDFLKMKYEMYNNLIIKNPYKLLEQEYNSLDYLNEKLVISIKNILNENSNKYVKYFEKLDALSPLNTLKRGYSIAIRDDKVIKDLADVNINDDIKIIINSGQILSKVTKKIQNKE